MKKLSILLAILIPLAQSCGGKDVPGAVTITLKFDGSVNQIIQDSIDQFVFVIGETGSTKKLLYPSACLGCLTSTTPCPTNDQCLESTDCGFSRSDPSFDPQIDFTDIAAGSTMDIISCALDSASAPVSGGQGTVKNTTGAKATVTMTSDVPDVTVCINALPATVCP